MLDELKQYILPEIVDYVIADYIYPCDRRDIAYNFKVVMKELLMLLTDDYDKIQNAYIHEVMCMDAWELSESKSRYSWKTPKFMMTTYGYFNAVSILRHIAERTNSRKQLKELKIDEMIKKTHCVIL